MFSPTVLQSSTRQVLVRTSKGLGRSPSWQDVFLLFYCSRKPASVEDVLQPLSHSKSYIRFAMCYCGERPDPLVNIQRGLDVRNLPSTGVLLGEY